MAVQFYTLQQYSWLSTFPLLTDGRAVLGSYDTIQAPMTLPRNIFQIQNSSFNPPTETDKPWRTVYITITRPTHQPAWELSRPLEHHRHASHAENRFVYMHYYIVLGETWLTHRHVETRL